MNPEDISIAIAASGDFLHALPEAVFSPQCSARSSSQFKQNFPGLNALLQHGKGRILGVLRLRAHESEREKNCLRRSAQNDRFNCFIKIPDICLLSAVNKKKIGLVLSWLIANG
jgi:hypothetical protein